MKIRKESLFFLADLHLKLSNSPLESQQLLLQSSLLPLQCSDLLLKPRVLRLLMCKMSFHFLFNSINFISKGLPHILDLHSQDLLQSLLL